MTYLPRTLRSRLWRPTRLMTAMVIALCACPAVAVAQTATAPALKAAYLYNFARFTEWPGDALGPTEPLVLCVINDRTVNDLLVDVTKGRTIDGHALVVRTVKPDAAALAPCRMVFATGLDAPRTAAWLDLVAHKPILTVSDADRFTEIGGIARFYVEKGSLRFAINLDAVQRSGVRLSSKLLGLATIVKDDRDAIRR